MADEAPAAESQISFIVKSSNEGKYNLTVPSTMTVLDLKQKLSTSEYADTPADRQRLIYSGRVLKDPDTLESCKIKDGNTVHLVKSAASNQRQAPANQGSSTSTPASSGAPPAAAGIPTNLATGTGHDPLAGLTGARFAGFGPQMPGMGMFGPDGGLGAPPNADAMLRMMDDPGFQQNMRAAMQSPAFLQMMQNNPMVRDNPMMREMFRDPELLRTMMDPTIIRAQLRMQRAMEQARGGGGGSFPAPGVTDTTPQTGEGQATGGDAATQNQGDNAGAQQTPPNPFGNLFGGAGAPGGAGANPFAALFGNPGQGATPAGSPPHTASAGQGTPAQSTPAGQDANPFANIFGAMGGGQNTNDPFARLLQNPAALQAAMQAMGGGDGGAGAGAGAGGFNPFGAFSPSAATSQAPADSRPPEERYADQLRQLNDMGFFDFDRNVQALRRSGGSVQGAVEFLLSNF